MRTTTQFPLFQPNAFILNAKCFISHLKVNTFLCCLQYFSRLANVLNFSLWTGALYSAYLSGTSGHRRSTITSEWAAAVQVISKSVRPQQQLVRMAEEGKKTILHRGFTESIKNTY